MKLLIIILPMLGFGVGVGVAQGLAMVSAASPQKSKEQSSETESFKLNKQFVVPIFHENKVDALVLASFNFQINTKYRQVLFDNDAPIKDAILSTLFAFSYGGGFDNVFISEQNVLELKQNLLKALQEPSEGAILEVLIEDIVRQDLR